MPLCMKSLACSKLYGHRSPCEKRVIEVTPALVTISYRKDGKDYLLSMPSDHAEWAEEMLSLDRAAVERVAAVKALTDAADEEERVSRQYKRTAYGMSDRGEWGDSSRYSNYAAGHAASASALRARAEACRREETE